MMGFGGYEGFGPLIGGGIMILMMGLFWIVPIALVAWAVASFRGNQRSSTQETSLEILRRRYANGEISQEEFEQVRRTLV